MYKVYNGLIEGYLPDKFSPLGFLEFGVLGLGFGV